MKNALHILCCAALLTAAGAPARADNDGVDQGLANIAGQTAAREACAAAARERGLDVRKAERIRVKENGPSTVTVETASRGNIDCEFDANTRTATLLGLPERGKDLDRGPLVKICEQVADQQRIRLGRFDEIKPLPGGRTEVRFDRAYFVGKRHTCLVDTAKNLVSFDGGQAVPLPGGSTPAKK